MMDDRIGSPCWYKQFDFAIKRMSWHGGTLLAWSTDFEELSNGVGQFAAGVIMDDKTGMCRSVHVSMICFANIPPAIDEMQKGIE